MDFQLTTGERVLWQGTPGQGIRFQAQDWFAVPFAVIWLGIVLAAFLSVPGDPANDDPAGKFILPFFLLIGLYVLVGRFVIDMFRRSRTQYALTNRRAIIESGLGRRSMRSVNLAAAPEIRLLEGGGGRGAIEFGAGSGFGMMMPRGWPGAGQFMPAAFESIDNARSVFGLIQDAQREAISQR